MLLQDHQLVLFIGDSITDYGRDRDNPDDMGVGYAQMAASWFAALYPAKGVRFLNRGIGGNRTSDLRARWQTDCLALAPDWVSILIGINDTWQGVKHGTLMPLHAFEDNYRTILTRTRDLGARLILMEPFVLHPPEDRAHWRDDLDPKIHTVRQLAREFEAVLVPLDGIFAAASTQQPLAFWAPDGVHPTMPGCALIAQAWLRAVGAI